MPSPSKIIPLHPPPPARARDLDAEWRVACWSLLFACLTGAPRDEIVMRAARMWKARRAMFEAMARMP
jgi:hypothetical protein